MFCELLLFLKIFKCRKTISSTTINKLINIHTAQHKKKYKFNQVHTSPFKYSSHVRNHSSITNTIITVAFSNITNWIVAAPNQYQNINNVVAIELVQILVLLIQAQSAVINYHSL